MTVTPDLVTELLGNVSFEEGAAVALAGVTAWRALIDYAELELCFIHGGTGGIGHLAVQFSAAMGAFTVATAGSEEARHAATEFGADSVLDYNHENLLSQVDRIADIVLDHRVHGYCDIEIAAFGGRIVQYSGEDGAFKGARLDAERTSPST